VDEHLSALEDAVLALSLAGSGEVLEGLRLQAATVAVLSREFTGVGFFTRVGVRSLKLALPGAPRLRISNVSAELPGLAHGAGFVVFVDEGLLSAIEGFSYDEPWPATVLPFQLSIA
jgi:hypothetical protein